MNATAASIGKDVDELALANQTVEVSQFFSVPRVAEAPVHLECKYRKTTILPGDTTNDNYCVVFG